jgi:hypothetical protein
MTLPAAGRGISRHQLMQNFLPAVFYDFLLGILISAILRTLAVT